MSEELEEDFMKGIVLCWENGFEGKLADCIWRVIMHRGGRPSVNYYCDAETKDMDIAKRRDRGYVMFSEEKFEKVKD